MNFPIACLRWPVSSKLIRNYESELIWRMCSLVERARLQDARTHINLQFTKFHYNPTGVTIVITIEPIDYAEHQL